MWYATQCVTKGTSDHPTEGHEADDDIELPAQQETQESRPDERMEEFEQSWAEIWHRLMCEEFLTIYRRKVLSQSKEKISSEPSMGGVGIPTEGKSDILNSVGAPGFEAPAAATFCSPTALVPILLPDFIRFLEVFTIEKSVREMYWAMVHHPSLLGIPANVLTHLCLQDKPRYLCSIPTSSSPTTSRSALAPESSMPISSSPPTASLASRVLTLPFAQLGQ